LSGCPVRHPNPEVTMPPKSVLAKLELAGEIDLHTGDRRGMHVEFSQFREGVGCAAVVAHADRDPERRLVLACAMPTEHLAEHGAQIRDHLQQAAREVAALLPASG